MEDPTALARVRALEARAASDGNLPAAQRLALSADAHRLAFATDDPALQVDALELLMSGELAAGHTERAHKVRVELERVALRWFRPRSIWAASVVEAAIRQAEGDADADDAARRAAERGTELGLPATALALGAHLFVAKLLGGAVAEVEAMATAVSRQTANTAAWTAGAALAAACAGHETVAREHLAEFRRRTANPSMWFRRPAVALAAAAAYALDDADVAAGVLTFFRGDPDAAVLVGFGGSVLGPETLWTALAAWTLGDHAHARDDLSAATTFADEAAWSPWTAVARELQVHLDDPTAVPPLGLPRRCSGTTGRRR